MVYNHLIVSLRVLKKNKVSLLINLFGLILASTICIIIFTFIKTEKQFDAFHSKKDRIYRLTGEVVETKEHFVNIPAAYYPFLLNEFPEIERVCRIYPWNNCTIRNEQNILTEKRILLVDSSFFNIFDFQLIIGDKNKVLTEPNQIVISNSTSKKLFGNKNPINEVISVDSYNFVVKGIFKDIPLNSSLQFDYLGTISSLKKIENEILENWNYSYAYTYILLKKDTDAKPINDRLKLLIAKTRGDRIASIINFKLFPFKDIYLKSSDIVKDIAIKGNEYNIYGFFIIGILILFLVAFNYVNLSLSSFSYRMKEIGLRKVFGARKVSVIYQLHFEAFVLSFFSLLLSILVAKLTIPFFNELIGFNIKLNVISIIPFSVLFLILLTISTASYPSFVISRLTPHTSFKPNLNIKYSFNQIPIILQFSISTILIISTILVSKQINFISKKKLGYNKDNLVLIINPEDKNTDHRYSNYYSNLSKISSVKEISGGYDIPSKDISMSIKFYLPGQTADESVQLGYVPVEHGFLSILESNIIAGRNFIPYNSADSNSVIINEAAVKSLRITSDEAMKIGINRLTERGFNFFKVIGIVNDIHFSSLRNPIEPIVFKLSKYGKKNILVRIQNNSKSQTLNILKKEWEKITSEWPFNFTFIDEEVNNLYRNDRILNRLLFFFTIIAIIISFIGILSLSIFLAVKRQKEIGIRKSIGASTNIIIQMLVFRFAKWILLSFIIAWPIVYIVINNWLANFFYHITIGVGIFVISGISIFIFGILVVGIVSYRYANINPVETLRYE